MRIFEQKSRLMSNIVQHFEAIRNAANLTQDDLAVMRA